MNDATDTPAIKPAAQIDCLAIAELAQMAGDNIPDYFWSDSQPPGQTIEEAGAQPAK